jgi:hypothetical protein
MTKIGEHEPTEADLASAISAHRIAILSFDREPTKLHTSDFLPRYNRLRIAITRTEPYPSSLLFLTVRRHGSKIGAENFYTVPMFAEELDVGVQAEYELMSFDSFNELFDSMSVDMCTFNDYMKRRVSMKHIVRAKDFAKLIRKHTVEPEGPGCGSQARRT